MRSFERQVDLHRQKLRNSEHFVTDWATKSARIQEGLLRHWRQELARNQELAQLAKEYAMEAVAEREKHRGQPVQEFYDGYPLGFHRIISPMQQQALAFGIDLKALQLDGIKPDRDLVQALLPELIPAV